MEKKTPADVLLLPSWYLPEGGEFCREQALFLNRAGIRADLLANVTLPWKKYPLKVIKDTWKDQLIDDDGILTYRRFHRPIPWQDERNAKRWIKATLDLFKRYIASSGKPRLIHAHSSIWAGYVAALIRREYGIPYVLTEHRGIFGMRSSLAERSFKSYYEPLLQRVFSDASYIIGVSDQQLPKIRTYLSRPVPLAVVSNMVDTDFFSRPASVLKESGFRFISVNSYRDVKGYDIMLPAFDRLCEQAPDVKLVLVGEDFDHPEFKQILSQCTHRDSIHFTGLLSREEVRRELCRADCLVISSRVEAQSISVLEALSMGIPVVCTDPIPRYVVGPEQGIRVLVEDIRALSAAMQKMIQTAGSYDPDSLSAHARHIASPRIVTRRLIAIYREVVPEVFEKWNF